jgi:predicted RNase H-like HicB family nuclease
MGCYLSSSDRHVLCSFSIAYRGDSLENMKLTAVFEPATEGGYTCFVEEIPAAISQGETLEEAGANLADALRLVLQYQRDLARRDLSPGAVRQSFDLVDA